MEHARIIPDHVFYMNHKAYAKTTKRKPRHYTSEMNYEGVL